MFRKIELRSAFNYDADEVSLETAFYNADPETGEEFPSMTQQSFKDDCDINEIVRRFGITGQLPENLNMPVSGDFTGVSDFHTMANMVAVAGSEFMKLPAQVRERFYNDPGKLIDFLDDPKNRDEADRLGLLHKEPEKTRDVVQAVDELAAKIVPASK